ncbi:MAG: hypothetical protein ACI9K2_007145, partial [Myxococcota bacterium]
MSAELDGSLDPRKRSALPGVAFVLIHGPYWALVLGFKCWLFAKHLPGLGLIAFVDGMWPQ